VGGMTPDYRARQANTHRPPTRKAPTDQKSVRAQPAHTIGHPAYRSE
jgi:hypothetical protein